MAKPAFFDCNVRIGRTSVPRPEHFTEVSELLAEMDRSGIERALAWHAFSSEWCPAKGNRLMLEEAEKEERISPCLVGLPPATRELPPPSEFAAMVREAGGAVRLFPKAHSYLLTETSVGGLLDELSDAHVPLLINIGDTNYAELETLLARHPALNVILLCLYYRVDRFIYPLLERYGNLHIESGTYGVHRGIESFCERFGPDRLIFGTDLPVHETGGPMALVTYANISPDAKRLIAGDNLRRLLGEEG